MTQQIPTPAPTTYQPCQECGAPMDGQQRYCINCAARRPDIANPAATYFAQASRIRARALAGPPVPAKSSGSRAASVIFFALLPIAVALGVLVGRGGGDDGGSGVDEAALLKALSTQTAASTAGGTPTTADTTATDASTGGVSKLITSDFTLQKGFVVEVATVPSATADSAKVDAAKSAAEKKGAKEVGVLDPGKFNVTPKPAGDAYVIYSGEFKSRGDAEKALAKLKKSFPEAEVLSVSSATDDTGAKVLAKTDHGTVHEVSGYTAPPEKVKQDTQAVNDIANSTGSDYLQAQADLPDVISVGGDPDNAPPIPTGAGD